MYSGELVYVHLYLYFKKEMYELHLDRYLLKFKESLLKFIKAIACTRNLPVTR